MHIPGSAAMVRLTREGFLFLTIACFCSGCYFLKPSSGGGQTEVTLPRQVDRKDVALARGYQIEAVAQGLTFPTGVAFDDSGRVYVVEAGYSYGEVWTQPQLLRLEANGTLTPIVKGQTNGPWTGVAFHEGAFYVPESDSKGGRILRLTMDGEIAIVLEGLPGLGDHHANGPVMSPDGWLVFGQGTASNSGVIGEDNAEFGWLSRRPQYHDIPGQDITLAGVNFRSGNPLSPGSEKVVTGAFLPFGTASEPKQVIPGQVPCAGGVMRVRPDGSGLSLIAWGFRNPFGFAYAPDGRLFVTDHGYDVRGSRPVWGAPDSLWHVEEGLWYGWPDYSAGMPLTDSRFKPPGKPQPQFLLAEHPNQPPKPAAQLGVHAASCGMDFSRNEDFGYTGEAFIALFGDQAPVVGKVMHPVGFKVVRVNVETGMVEPFAENKGRKSGPASLLNHGGLERPVAVRFNPAGDALYIVDFGIMQMTPMGAIPRAGTGVLWKITRAGKGSS